MAANESETRAEKLRRRIDVHRKNTHKPGGPSSDGVLLSLTIEAAALEITDKLDHVGERIFYMLDQTR